MLGRQAAYSPPSMTRVSEDVARLLALGKLLRSTPTPELTAQILGPGCDPKLLELMGRTCCFRHAGLLIFPRSHTEAPALLSEIGFKPGAPLPSTIVKSRLMDRYGLTEGQLNVRIIHGRALGAGGELREIELYVVTSRMAIGHIALRERTMEHEAHFAFRVRNARADWLQSVLSALLGAGFRLDGGGYNPYQDPSRGGTSSVYLLRPSGRGVAAAFRRLELQCHGDHLGRLELR